MTESLVMAELLGAHGIKGWIKVRPLLDDPMLLAGLEGLTMAPGAKTRREPEQPVAVIGLRRQGRGWVMQIAGICDRNDAESLRGRVICGTSDMLPQLEADEFYWRDLEGLRVWSEEAGVVNLLGEVDYLLETGANDVLVVRPCEGSADDRERLIPWVWGDVVTSVDVDEGEVRVRWYLDA